MKMWNVSLLACLLLCGRLTVAAEPADLKDVLKDTNAFGADHWIYNNLESAVAEARLTGKPIFVTFRCVPCKNCAGFDAEVANGSEIIRDLAKKKFVSLRQVEMKGVDLTQFQFDYDLNWAAMFINADGTVYARYGTQSAEGADAYNSIGSLEQTMSRVLELHAKYPVNAAELKGKRGEPKPYKTALEMPGMEDKEKLRQATVRNNCVHCHMIHDAQMNVASGEGSLSQKAMWRYPLPENMGVRIDREDGRRIEKILPDSPASRAGLAAGDELTRLDGQAITSIADLQWVLHNLPMGDATLAADVLRDGKKSRHELKLTGDWKKTDWTWRSSRWSLRPRPGFWSPELNPAEIAKLALPDVTRAMRVQWINLGQAEGRQSLESGLREGDIIIAIDGKPVSMDPEKFHMHVRMHYKVGDDLPLTVIRGGKRIELKIPLIP
jgi:serine protease Do